MSFPVTVNFSIYRGAAFGPLQFNFKNDDGTPFNLSGFQVISEANNGQGPKIDLQPIITDSANGIVQENFSSSYTLNFVTGEQAYDLFLVHPSLGNIGPYALGTITVNDRIS